MIDAEEYETDAVREIILAEGERHGLLVIEQITQAFDGVERGNGVTMHQAFVSDNCGGATARAAARLLDTDPCWQDVPDADIERHQRSTHRPPSVGTAIANYYVGAYTAAYTSPDAMVVGVRALVAPIGLCATNRFVELPLSCDLRAIDQKGMRLTSFDTLFRKPATALELTGVAV